MECSTVSGKPRHDRSVSGGYRPAGSAFLGDLDQFLLIDTAHRVHQRLKRSELTVFESGGPFPFHDKRDAFAAMIADWVEAGYLSLDRKPG